MPNDRVDALLEEGATVDESPTATSGQKRRRSGRRNAVEWGAIVVAAVLVSFLLRTFVIQTYYIPSGSMEPTLLIHDHIIVSKLSLDFGSIHRGDILVFKAPPPADVCGDDTPTDFVKRVIGLPGDHLTSKGNTIYVNGKALDITWTHYEPLGRPIGNVTVAKNHYFMMGDNYPQSCDSRYWGSVPRSDIIGRAFFRIWPLSGIGFL